MRPSFKAMCFATVCLKPLAYAAKEAERRRIVTARALRNGEVILNG